MGAFGDAFTVVCHGFAWFEGSLHWRDFAAMAMIASAGSTVSLLIGDLAYPGTEHSERVITAVLIASPLAPMAAAVTFRPGYGTTP